MAIPFKVTNDLKNKFWKFYHSNSVISKFGSFNQNLKTGYWQYFRESGKKEKEGHYITDKKVKWWLFYDDNEKINHKCQLKDNQKNGYCLMYKNEALISAVKFKAGQKIKEWTDLKSFKRENKLSDLK